MKAEGHRSPRAESLREVQCRWVGREEWRLQEAHHLEGMGEDLLNSESDAEGRNKFEGTYHRGIHRADPFQEAAFHQGGMGAHLEASWEGILGLGGMEDALWMFCIRSIRV